MASKILQNVIGVAPEKSKSPVALRSRLGRNVLPSRDREGVGAFAHSFTDSEPEGVGAVVAPFSNQRRPTREGGSSGRTTESFAWNSPQYQKRPWLAQTSGDRQKDTKVRRECRQRRRLSEVFGKAAEHLSAVPVDFLSRWRRGGQKAWEFGRAVLHFKILEKAAGARKTGEPAHQIVEWIIPGQTPGCFWARFRPPGVCSSSRFLNL
jgi:hypothetical protein